MAETEQRDAAEAPPSLIASHVSVTYRVFGAKKMGTVSSVPTGGRRLARLLKGRTGSIGAVREIKAVQDVSFIARDGESIGIIGRNGSGKSTLLRALAGLIPPSSGEIYTAGSPALLGVNAVLMRELSGERNVMIGGQALGLSAREVREKLPGIVEFAGVGDFIDLPMKAYSSGMAARLRFAISTAAVPDILMIDEALATGDADFQERSRQRVAEIREHAGTVFLVSHSDTTIRAMCDRALWLEQGKLLMDGPADAVCDAYQRTYQKPAPKKAPAKKAPVKKAPATKPAPKPASEKPAADKSAAEDPAPKPAAEKPAAEKPAAEGPAAEGPAAEGPAAEKPAAEKPAAEGPAPEPAPVDQPERP